VEPAQRAIGVATCPTSLIEPAGDVLTWRLARRVMIDHELDAVSDDGACRTCGQPWPCDAWRRAEDIAVRLTPWDSPAS
jgi:hypothetical protein